MECRPVQNAPARFSSPAAISPNGRTAWRRYRRGCSFTRKTDTQSHCRCCSGLSTRMSRKAGRTRLRFMAMPGRSHRTSGSRRASCRRFQGTLRDELSRARVVSVFSRLHPLIPQQGMLAGLGECVENGQTISIDLTLPDEEQRAHYNKSCRRVCASSTKQDSSVSMTARSATCRNS